MNNIIISYEPKNYRSREFALTLNNKLNKAGIETRISKESKVKHYIFVSQENFEKAEQLRQEYSTKKQADYDAFKKGIKLEQNSRFNQFNVDSLYNRLKNYFPSQIYLPDGWKGGKSIQNYSQSDFYSFERVNIKGSLTLNGPKVIMTTFSKRFVLILPVDFQSRLGGLIEDKKMDHSMSEATFESLLTEIAEKRFEGVEWAQFFTEKKMFYVQAK